MKYPTFFIGTFQNSDPKILEDIIYTGCSLGTFGIDTAPSYKSEIDLGKALHSLIFSNKINREDVFVSDKIDIWQMADNNKKISQHVMDSVKKLQLEYLDLMLVHWPYHDYLKSTWRELENLYSDGLIKQIGICNVKERHLEDLLSYSKIRPHCIQIERHPLRTCYDIISYCQNANIKVIAYSPLCRMDKNLTESEILNMLSKKYKKSIGQIILRWHIDTNVIPVFMSTKVSRVKENLDIFDFVIKHDEIEQIDELNKNYKYFLESTACPGY